MRPVKVAIAAALAADAAVAELVPATSVYAVERADGSDPSEHRGDRR